MFDVGASELLLIIVVAIVVIGPKDLPAALRTAGRWIAKIRRVSGHFRSGIETMIREAEMEEMERKWRDKNDEIMRTSPDSFPGASAEAGAEAAALVPPADETGAAPKAAPHDEAPQLPLTPP